MYKTINIDSFEIDKKNVIMISVVQRRLPFLVLQKDHEEILFVCSRFSALDGGIYKCFNAYTQFLCSDAKELRDLTVSEIESTVIQSWKVGREQERRCPGWHLLLHLTGIEFRT